MLDWLGPNTTPDANASPGELVLRLVLAAVFGVAVAAVYFVTQRKQRAEAASFVATLVLLSVLLAMVSMVIGSNIARAFSLVGALAIVRFRTVVDDTRDTAFVIFAVVTGMAVGAGAIVVPLVGIPVVAVVAAGLSYWGGTTARMPANSLHIRLSTGSDPAGPLAIALAKHLREQRLVSAGTAKQGAALDLIYSVRLKDPGGTLAMLADLNRVEGVQSVEWSENYRKN